MGFPYGRSGSVACFNGLALPLRKHRERDIIHAMSRVSAAVGPDEARHAAGLRWVMWAAPAVFLVHDLEEVVTVEPWLATHRADLPTVVQPLAALTQSQFATGVLILFAGMVVATFHGRRRVRQGRFPALFLFTAGMLVANAISHLLQAAFFGGYTPGVITALLLVVPYGLVLAHRFIASHLMTLRTGIAFLAVGALAQIPVVILTLLVVSRRG